MSDCAIFKSEIKVIFSYNIISIYESFWYIYIKVYSNTVTVESCREKVFDGP